jgi:iron complex outermembrane receptor protein
MGRCARVAAALIGMLAVGQGPAGAQEPQAEPQPAPTGRQRTVGIEAITVTAEKRETLLQETPIAITAFTTSDIEAFGFEQTDDIGYFTPGIQADASTTQHGQVSFFGRGVGSADNHAMVEQSMGLYIDGAYSGTGNASLFSLMDVERIEVLRGPQGTLFGRNTIGGAINVISIKPQAGFGAKAKLALGTYHKRELSGTLNVPILGQELLGRFSFARILRDDFYENDGAGEDLDDRNRWAARSALRWLPTEELTVDWVFDWTDTDEHNNQWISSAPFGFSISPTGVATKSQSVDQLFALGVGLGFLPPFPASDPRSRGFSAYLDNEPGDAFEDGGEQRYDTKNNALTIAWDATDHLQLKAIGGWRKYRIGRENDGDGSPWRLFEGGQHTKHRNFLAELQAIGDVGDGRLNYTLGVNWFEQEASDEGWSDLFLDLFPLVNASSAVGTDYDAYALGYYGQGTLAITEKLDLTAGLRYTAERKSVSYVSCARDLFRKSGPATRNFQTCVARNSAVKTPAAIAADIITDDHIKAAGVPLDTRFDSWTPMVKASYDWTDELMTYLTWAKGYRSGGYGNRIATISSAEPFKDETVYSWEAGFKSQFWDNRVQLNVAGYYNQYEDQQVTTFIPGAGIATFIQNAGNSRIRGYEIDVLTQPIEGLRIYLTHGWVEVDYIEFGNPDLKDIKAKGIHVPKRKYAGFVEYTFPTQAWGTLSVNGSFVREGPKEWLDNKVQNLTTRSNRYTRYDAQVRLDDVLGYQGLSLAVVGSNLTDKVYKCCQGIDFGLYQGGGFGDPREVWVEIGYEFGDGI